MYLLITLALHFLKLLYDEGILLKFELYIVSDFLYTPSVLNDAMALIALIND